MLLNHEPAHVMASLAKLSVLTDGCEFNLFVPDEISTRSALERAGSWSAYKRCCPEHVCNVGSLCLIKRLQVYMFLCAGTPSEL